MRNYTIHRRHTYPFFMLLLPLYFYVSVSPRPTQSILQKPRILFSLLTKQCMIHLLGLSQCWFNNHSSHWPSMFYIAFLPSLYISAKLILCPGLCSQCFISFAWLRMFVQPVSSGKSSWRRRFCYSKAIGCLTNGHFILFFEGNMEKLSLTYFPEALRAYLTKAVHFYQGQFISLQKWRKCTFVL